MAKLATSKEVLKKRIQRLLRMDRKLDESELTIKTLPLLRSLGEVALIGGAIRDLARLGKDGFSSDLDFVVHSSSREIFRDTMSAIGAKPNRFGGFALPYRQWKVDVWHLEDTWARTAGLRKVEQLSDLLKCTFFDWDSAVFDLRTSQLTFGEDYLNLLASQVMNVCLEENPNPDGSLVRALRRAALWGVRFGAQLTAFSSQHIRRADWSQLVERDRSAFGDSVLRHLDRDELICRLELIDMTAKVQSSFPVPEWNRQPRLPFASERTNLGPGL